MTMTTPPLSSASPTRLALLGATGRLGRAIDTLCSSSTFPDLHVAERISRQHPFSQNWSDVDVILDVSLPEFSHSILEFQSRAQVSIPWVIGSTGWTPEQRKAIERLASKTTIVLASNFSLGIAVISSLLRQASKALVPLGFSVAIEDIHHIHKRDQPSGTALHLNKIVENFGANPVIHSRREGEEIGFHAVAFHSPLEDVVLQHKAHDRILFAQGALTAARWAKEAKRHGRFGIFSMEDVLFTPASQK